MMPPLHRLITVARESYRAAALVGCVLLPGAIPACSSTAEAPSTAPARPVAPPKPPVTLASPATGGTPSHTHTIGMGETLWDIARAYGTSTHAILEANGLSERDIRRIRPGQPLKIPGASGPTHVETAAQRAQRKRDRPPPEDGHYHEVLPGETVWLLASHFDIDLNDLLERNGLDDESANTLRAGTELIIPGVRAPKASKRPAQRREPKGIRHRIAAGQTIWDLAQAFGVGAGEIMAANGFSDEQVTRLREGQRVLIPGVSKDIAGKVTRAVSARGRRADAKANRLGLGTRRTALKLLQGRVESRWLRAAGGDTRLPGYLKWPVTKGWYVRGYGSGEGGYHLATDIMGKIGWNVRAAAPGLVAYSGDSLRGYGNTVLVVHPGGWVTMYAHNSVNFVRAGDTVKRGAILAEVGSTGISRGPHVHFELIFNGRNCDPAALFKPGVRYRRAGKHPASVHAPWTHPQKRPKSVACDRRRRHPRSRWVLNERHLTSRPSSAPAP